MPIPSIVLIHACACGLSLATGAAAMVLPKGERHHRIAGDIFLTAMLCLSASGAWIALRQMETATMLANVLGFYLVATGWVAAVRREGRPGLFDRAALLVAALAGAAGLLLGSGTLHAPGLLTAAQADACLVLGAVALLAAALDLRMLAAGGISGALRIARHLWRMCGAMGIATASLILGQQDLLPAELRGSTLLDIPLLLILAVMVYWLLRVLVNGIAGHGGPVRNVLRRLRGKRSAGLPPMQQAVR